MGILILRGILKLNKSISSKKPFAQVRANVQSAPNASSEEMSLEMCSRRLGGGGWGRGNGQDCVSSQNLCPKPPTKMNYELNQTTSNESSETFCLKFF